MKLWSSFSLALLSCMSPIIAFAQTAAEQEQAREAIKRANEAAATGCAACSMGIGVVLFMIFVIIVLHIALCIWVARDAKARGMDSAVIWMIFAVSTGLIGFIIYLFSRPQGNLASCPKCRGKRLQASAICPHCGNP